MLLGILICIPLLAPDASAQAPVSLTITVQDRGNAPIAGASVQKPAGHMLGHTDAEGRFTFNCELPCRIRVDAEGFAGSFFELAASATVHLARAGVSEQITVTAYREPLGAPPRKLSGPTGQ